MNQKRHTLIPASRTGFILVLMLAAVLVLSACAPVPGAAELPEAVEPPGETAQGSSPTTSGEQPQSANPTEPNVSPPAGGDAVRTPKHTPEPVPGGKGALIAPETPVIGEVPDEILEKIYADMADQYGVDLSNMQLLRAEQMIWQDGSLGCAEPGQMYTMALVDGYWVQVQIGDELYDYRATQQGTFKRCNQFNILPGLPTGGTPTE